MLKGAIVGVGYIAGRGHLPAYMKMSDVRIVAVADISPRRLAHVRRLLPHVRTYCDAESLLAAEHDLDFIDIATPPVFHAEIARMAATRGIHVLCEKPITVSTAEARDLILTAAREQVVIFPCHNYKHAPVIQEVRRILDSGVIGEVRAATLSTYRPTHAKGVGEWRPDWRRQGQFSGGGIAMDHGSHSFYLMFMFMNGYPTSVSAKAFNTDPRWNTEDNVAAALSFPNGFCNVFLTWTAGSRKVIYTIQGTRGSITINDDEFELVTPAGSDRRTIVSAFNDASHASWFTSMFSVFRGCIESGDWVSTELIDAYMCVNLIESIYESAESGCRDVPINVGLEVVEHRFDSREFGIASVRLPSAE